MMMVMMTTMTMKEFLSSNIFLIFTEYGVLKEFSGLRRAAGYGVSVSRGAAAAMTITFSTLLLTMSRNTLTFLRETQAMNWIPFDSAIAFHKYVAVLALFFTGWGLF